MRAYLPSFLLGIFVLMTMTVAQLAPPEKGAVVAVFPPKISSDAFWHAVHASDAYFVSKGAIPGTFVLWGDTPGLPGKLKDSGALLVLNAAAASVCGAKLPDFSTQFMNGIGDRPND